MGTEEDLAKIMEMIGWWLKSTEQGMWRTDLQTAEESLCVGWLLFLAKVYNKEALSHEIWNLTGIRIALCYQAIDDRAKTDNKTKSTPVKALHIEMDRVHQTVTCSQIKYLYSSKATVFPSGLKMQLVCNHRLLTNIQAKAKEASLRAHQAQFLGQIETCLTWEIATLDLID